MFFPTVKFSRVLTSQPTHSDVEELGSGVCPSLIQQGNAVDKWQYLFYSNN